MAEPTTRTPTHYDILGVRPTASPQQIRRAFRDLSKLYHPDTTELPAAEATEKFQQLNEAYAVLSSPDRRWSYDKKVGYSRISVMQPLQPLSQSQASPRRKEVSNLYLDPNDRPLSAGEIFALFILGLTFVACLALVVTIGFTRGETALSPADIITPQPVEVVLPAPSPAAPETPTAPPKPLIKKQVGLNQPGPTPSEPAADNSPSAAESPPAPKAKAHAAPPAQPTWL